MRVREAPRQRIDLGDRPANHGREFYSKNFTAQHRTSIPHFPKRFEDRDHSYREFKNNSRRLWREDAPPKARLRAEHSENWRRNVGRDERRFPVISDFLQSEINTDYDNQKFNHDSRKTDYDTRKIDYDFRKTDYDFRKNYYDSKETEYDNKNTYYDNRRHFEREIDDWESTQRDLHLDYDPRKIYTRVDDEEPTLRRPDQLIYKPMPQDNTKNKKGRKGHNKKIHDNLNIPDQYQYRRGFSRLGRETDRSENRTRNDENVQRAENQTQYDEYVQEDEFVETTRPGAELRGQRDIYSDSVRASIRAPRAPAATGNRNNREINTTYNRDAYNTHHRERDRVNRFLPRKERQGERQIYFQQNRDKNLEKPNYTPPPPRLKLTMKLMYDLIRTVHHLQKVTTKITDNSPMGFQRLAQFLIDTVKPAAPTRKTRELLEGNARNWIYNTQLILEEHYEAQIQQTITDLTEGTNQEDWHHAFEVACNWARKNFRDRLQEEVFERTEALFLAHKSTERTREVNEETENAQTVIPLRTQTEKQTVEKPQVVRNKTVTVNAQTSPINIEPGSPHTPVHRGDWSFDEGEFPPLRPPTILPTPSRPLSPLKQRIPRRICTEMLVNIEEPEETEREVTSEIVSQPPKTKGAETVESINETREVDDESVTPRKHMEKKKNNKPAAERVGTSRPSLSRIEASPILFSENSNECSLADSVPRSVLTRFLEENQEFIAQMGETTDTGLEEEINCMVEKVLPQEPETPKSIGRPNKHVYTNKKNQDWSLNLKKKYVIIGDSNVARIPIFDDVDLQIDCFPGAKFQHAGNLMEKATIAVEPEVLIFSFGINNRAQRCIGTTTKEIQRTYRMARRRLPHTELHFPIINFSEDLPWEEQMYLDQINDYIRDKLIHIMKLPTERFKVERDLIHWTPETAKAMLEHWINNLNFQGPSSR